MLNVRNKVTDMENKKMSKVYTVEILALFEIQLKHVFSSVEINNSGRTITDTFDHIILEITGNFSSFSIDIDFESAKRRRQDNTYKLTGSIKRCYEFPEEYINECELIDGVDDSNLEDMKLAVNYACEQSGYELTIIHFEWADDYVIEEN